MTIRRAAFFAYGAACYAVFFATFLYAVGFIGNFGVARTIDSGPPAPVGRALLVDALLLGLFAVQHSAMARPAFKRRWTRIVPRPLERSTYVLASSLALIVLFRVWLPIPAVVWDATGTWLGSLLQGGFFGGVLLVLYATFLIDHFDLFGMRQVFLHLRGVDYTEKRFATPSLYRWIRHPLYVGWFLTFWSTPVMSAGHFLFAVGTTFYILAAIPLEERDLASLLGDEYRRYRERTPKFLPIRRGR
jgi:protein-S-isoprenylcysteine O-methyltransferase Ste14